MSAESILPVRSSLCRFSRVDTPALEADVRGETVPRFQLVLASAAIEYLEAPATSSETDTTGDEGARPDPLAAWPAEADAEELPNFLSPRRWRSICLTAHAERKPEDIGEDKLPDVAFDGASIDLSCSSASTMSGDETATRFERQDSSDCERSVYFAAHREMERTAEDSLATLGTVSVSSAWMLPSSDDAPVRIQRQDGERAQRCGLSLGSSAASTLPGGDGASSRFDRQQSPDGERPQRRRGFTPACRSPSSQSLATLWRGVAEGASARPPPIIPRSPSSPSALLRAPDGAGHGAGSPSPRRPGRRQRRSSRVKRQLRERCKSALELGKTRSTSRSSSLQPCGMRSQLRRLALGQLDAQETRAFAEEMLFQSLPRENVILQEVIDVGRDVPRGRFLQTLWTSGCWAQVRVAWHLSGSPQATRAISERGIRCDVENCTCGRYGRGGYVALSAAKANAYAPPDNDAGPRQLFLVLALPEDDVVQGERGVRHERTAADLPGHPTEYCFVNESRLLCVLRLRYQWISTGRREKVATAGPRASHFVRPRQPSKPTSSLLT